jgi:hypothetical protein
MTSLRAPLLALAALTLTGAALTLTGVAQAAEPEAVATAAPTGTGAPTAAGAPSSVADQIDNYLKTSPALALPKDAASGVVSGEAPPRQVHGVVDVAVGSNGYRSAFVASEIPVGQSGTATIAVGETRFNGRGWYGPGYRGGPTSSQTLALGLSLGGAEPRDWRCRQAMEAAAEARLDGPSPNACRSRLSPPAQ